MRGVTCSLLWATVELIVLHLLSLLIVGHGLSSCLFHQFELLLILFVLHDLQAVLSIQRVDILFSQTLIDRQILLLFAQLGVQVDFALTLDESFHVLFDEGAPYDGVDFGSLACVFDQ